MTATPRTIVAGVLQASVLVLGHWAGTEAHYLGRPPTAYTWLVLLPVAFLVSGYFRQFFASQGGSGRACGWALVYVVLTLGNEPFIHRSGWGLAFAATMLCVPMVANIYLARIHE